MHINGFFKSLFLVTVACVGLVSWSLSAPMACKDTVISIANGSGLIMVNKVIKSNQNIKHPWIFTITTRAMAPFVAVKIFPGNHAIKAGSNVFDILNSISKEELIKVTVPEGLTTIEIAELLNAIPNLTDFVNIKDLKEGFLMPETYMVPFGISRKKIISMMEKDMISFVEANWPNRDPELIIKTPYEALILASIIEKEAQSEEHAPIIASVFFNRLKKSMRLQADSCIVYAKTNGQSSSFKRNVFLNDLKVDSKYNVYKYHGLPPTPISNPGRTSILATLHPHETNYLFFITNSNAEVQYFETFDQHVKYKIAKKLGKA